MVRSFKRSSSLKKGKLTALLTILSVALLVAVAVCAFLLLEWEKPQIKVETDLAIIGGARDVTVSFADGRSGLQGVEVILVQGDKTFPVYAKTWPRTGYFGAVGPGEFKDTFVFDPKALKLGEGQAEVVVRARDFSWLNWGSGNSTEQRTTALVDTRPPHIQLVDNTRYVTQGGSGIVLYEIDEEASEHGVLLNGFLHRGHPLSADRKNIFVALVAFPYDADTIEQAEIVATDRAGNTGKSGLLFHHAKKKWKHDSINIGDGFLDAKMPEFAAHYPEMQGSPEEQFLFVNGEVRRRNSEQILEICSKPSAERLWAGRFLRMERSSPKAGFADHRTYFYNGKEIDKQVHLGLDLASTSRAAVHAANRGRVVFADYLGIYGKMVVLDHGQGLFSLYSHLSDISVNVGDLLEANQPLGASGLSGMAGGDHLHFSILINGIFVDPFEWFDDNWIKLKLTDLLPK